MTYRVKGCIPSSSVSLCSILFQLFLCSSRAGEGFIHISKKGSTLKAVTKIIDVSLLRRSSEAAPPKCVKWQLSSKLNTESRSNPSKSCLAVLLRLALVGNIVRSLLLVRMRNTAKTGSLQRCIYKANYERHSIVSGSHKTTQIA